MFALQWAISFVLMKALFFSFTRLVVTSVFFFTFSGLRSQTTTPTLITANLSDGTKIWGILNKENETELTVFDFNLGEVRITKKDVKGEEREKLETMMMIETVNNISYFGLVTGANATTLMMKTALLDTIEIQLNTISKISVLGSYVNRKGKNWFVNPNSTRYFFAPSAIPLKKREGYYQNAYLLANSVNVGLTNNITIGGGVVIPLLFYVTPKISFPVRKNLYLGAGILFTQSFLTDFHLSAGIGYGLVTVGNPEHNLTMGLGYGYSKFDNSYKATSMPIVTLNGMTRIGRRLSLITENWLIPRSEYTEEYTTYDSAGMAYFETVNIKKDYYSVAASLGLRFMLNTKTSIDFSVVGINTNPKGNYLVLPYLDFVYKFN